MHDNRKRSAKMEPPGGIFAFCHGGFRESPGQSEGKSKRSAEMECQQNFRIPCEGAKIPFRFAPLHFCTPEYLFFQKGPHGKNRLVPIFRV